MTPYPARWRMILLHPDDAAPGALAVHKGLAAIAGHDVTVHPGATPGRSGLYGAAEWAAVRCLLDAADPPAPPP